MGRVVRKPNLFLVGTPTCGMTAMNEFLEQSMATQLLEGVSG